MNNWGSGLLKILIVGLFVSCINVVAMEQKGSDDGKNDYTLGCTYLKRNELSAAKYAFIIASEKGHQLAQRSLGLLYLDEDNLDLAKKYLELASQQNDTIASYNLGDIYELEGDISKARKYFIKSALGGYIDAHNRLGIIFAENDKDAIKAEQYFQYAADMGSLNGVSNLGFLYERLNDLKNAQEHYQFAADKGYVPAQYRLGKLYLQLGNIIEAEKCFLWLVYKHRHVVSMFELGNICYKQSNVVQARMFYSMAAMKGHIGAQEQLTKIENASSPDAELFANTVIN